MGVVVLERVIVETAAAESVESTGRSSPLGANVVPGGVNFSVYSRNGSGVELLYTFQVQAANSDGVWNQTGASLEFELQPHLYQTAWFYTLCGLALILGGWGIYLLRLRVRLQRQARAATSPPPA